MFGVKDPIPYGLRTFVVYNFYGRAALPAMPAKPSSIYPHVCVSTWSVIGSLTFSHLYIILHNVALFVLMGVSAC